MNRKAGYAFRIVLGGYLAYIGIRILMQMIDKRPSNMVFMSVMAVIFAVIGSAYAIYSLKKVWDMRKEEMTDTDTEADEELADVGVRPDTDVRPIDIKSLEEKPKEKPPEDPEEKPAGNEEEKPAGDPEEKPEGNPETKPVENPEEKKKKKEENVTEEQEEEIENDYEEK